MSFLTLFPFIFLFTIDVLAANPNKLTLKKIGVKNLVSVETPTPAKVEGLYSRAMKNDQDTQEPLVIRPNIEYDDYLNIKPTAPKILGVNFLMNY